MSIRFSFQENKLWTQPINRMTQLPISFEEEEFRDLQRKFKKMSASNKDIDRESFDRNIGLIGLHNFSGFSARLFNSFDLDQDGKINFQDFIEYMEIIKEGGKQSKALISFRLIDIKNRGVIGIEDFRSFIREYRDSWGSITNTPISPELRRKTQKFLVRVFKNIEEDLGKQQIDLQYYVNNLYGEDEFMEKLLMVSGELPEMLKKNSLQTNSSNLSFYETLSRLHQIYQAHFSSQFHHTPDHRKTPDQREINLEKIIEQKDRQIELLQDKLLAIERDLKRLKLETSEEFEKMKQKNVPEDDIQLDIAAIIASIPKEPYKKDKSQGRMISFGDQSWNLVLNMMIGIQMAVQTISDEKFLQEEPKDFEQNYVFQLIPRKLAEDKNKKQTCSFTDYAPNTFNHLRHMLKINKKQYMECIGPNKLMKSLVMGQLNTLTQLTSQGKSGSFFYYTPDGKYMIKTIKNKELVLLRKILKDYYFHIKQHPDSLLIKFLGLYRIQFKGSLIGQDQISFVVMRNIFNTKEKIIERYDIKGSTFQRTNPSLNPDATKKDLDFINKYHLGLELHDPSQREYIMQIMEKDSYFLRQHDILDYSLLIGIYQRPKALFEDFLHDKAKKMYKKDKDKRHCYLLKGQQQGIALGIIDILIEYDGRKQVQSFFKKMIHGEGVSAIPPGDYALRFDQFISMKVFPKSSNQEHIENKQDSS